jgi:hypothetical protein
MRLLRCTDDGDFILTKFTEDEVPPYAILSHTWGADEDEVSFKDLMDGKIKSKEAGLRKLQFCGDQAAKDDLRFFWVDTCCIDKSNNNEISEAINSMFRWYRKATKCYAYLADVAIGTTTDTSMETSISGSVPDDHSSQQAWEPAFRISKWFTRGWTLQELIAPKSVDFFSAEGHWLGDKASLEQQIHEITGVALQALQGTPLAEFGVDERMAWASRRQTKLKEDAAYCLLGIFGIYMPLIYGEGRENAFSRLRRKIKKSQEGKRLVITNL